MAGSRLPLGRKKSRNASLLSFMSFPRERTEGGNEQRASLPSPVLQVNHISVLCPRCWALVFRDCEQNYVPLRIFFFKVLVSFCWDKWTKAKILPTVFSELYKLSKDSGQCTCIYSRLFCQKKCREVIIWVLHQRLLGRRWVSPVSAHPSLCMDCHFSALRTLITWTSLPLLYVKGPSSVSEAGHGAATCWMKSHMAQGLAGLGD